MYGFDTCGSEKESNSTERIEKTVCSLLTEAGLKLATAESCTGGMVAQKITSVAGASECFECGVVTYSNEQKKRLLGVRPDTLSRFGAVSRETALEMCRGIKETAGADFGIGITGIAGPGGGTAEKPVGLVYIGICGENIHEAYEFHFTGSRDEVRQSAANAALRMVAEAILRR